MFVQAAEPLPPDSELELAFELPDAAHEIAPTAVVVWRRERAAGAAPGLAPGMGLQFLRLDRESADRIDDFVYQHAAPASRPLGHAPASRPLGRSRGTGR
jgi:hypothetical protein